MNISASNQGEFLLKKSNQYYNVISKKNDRGRIQIIPNPPEQ